MSDETLMTAAATTAPEGADASDPATETTATVADEGGTNTPAGEPQGAATTDQAPGADDTPAKPEGAPEQYAAFTAPEGQAFDDTVITAFTEVARKLNLPQDKAQLVLDEMAPVLAARQAEQFQGARTEWAEASKTDKEFGGDKLKESLASALKARDTFATPELRTLLEQSGLGNHPEVVRLFYRVGKAISEDRMVTGSANPGKSGDARGLYKESNMNP
ncbi:MAG: protease [Brachymonas sp.]